MPPSLIPARSTAFDRIEASAALREAVSFEPWGNDVAAFYRKTDIILSPSDFESFHYALADGVLSGCLPLVWPWDEATTIYTDDWIVADTEEASKRVMAWRAMGPSERDAQARAARDLIVSRYGFDTISKRLDEALKLGDVTESSVLSGGSQ